MKSEEFQKTIIEAIQDFRQEMHVELGRINENVKKVNQEVSDIRRETRAINSQITGILHLIKSHEEVKDLQSMRMDNIEERLKRLEGDCNGASG